jgi:hypothetical protein
MIGQQDQLALAKKASVGGMKGILYKNIAGPDPMQAARGLGEEVRHWAEDEGVEPCSVWAGFIVGMTGSQYLSEAPQRVRQALDDGAGGIWLPVFTHVNTVTRVVNRMVEPTDPLLKLPPRDRPLHGPLPLEKARHLGHYLLDEHGKLIPEIKEVLRVIVDYDAPMSFGHIGHDERQAVADELAKYRNYRAAFVDHPMSPFVEMGVDEMKQFAKAGHYLNFTYDELSPLLGIDPYEMFGAIAQLDSDYVTLSSDAGEPLFPDTVECLRLMGAYARAYGIADEDVQKMMVDNPAKVMSARPTA